MTRPSKHARARLEVLLGALAFAASVPAGKRLLHELSPLAISGGLYLAAGMFCLLLLVLDTDRDARATLRLRGGEWGWLAAAVGLGGVLGPIALFQGLQWSSGHVAGLLLNFEAVFTVGLAALFSRERVGRRGAGGIALVLLGAVALSAEGRSGGGVTRPIGALLVIAACACWGLDNNVTQRISLRDARVIVAVKGLVGGATSLALAALAGRIGGFGPSTIAAVLVIGALSYGLSIVLFIRGLRELGVMHTGALFALAPGFAALLSWIVLREPVSPFALVTLGAMTAGALLLATDVHEHVHTHEAVEHEHEHVHDEHHRHEHAPGDPEGEPHTHRHRHPARSHSHPHTHDVHHRHGHGGGSTSR